MYKLDVLSPEPTFYHESNSKYKSALGGCLTLVNVVLFVVLTIYLGFDLFVRESPEVSSSMALAPQTSLNTEDFQFSITIHYAGGFDIPELDRKLKFEVDTIYTDSSQDPPSVFNRVALVPCPQTKYYKDSKYKLSSMAISSPESYYCPPDDLDYRVTNPFGHPKFDVVDLVVSYCTDRPDCYSEDFIKKNLTDIYLQVTMKDYYVDAFNFDKPIQDNFSQVMLAISSEFTQTIGVYFREILFKNEEGWIFPQKSTFTGHKFDHYNFSLAGIGNSKRILVLTFSFDSFKEVFNRHYIKVQDVLGQVAGSMKVIMTLFKFILELYSTVFLTKMRMRQYKQPRIDKTSINNLVSSTSKEGSFVKLSKFSSSLKKEKFSMIKLFLGREFRNVSTFRKNYKRIFSEQNLFELCALQELRSRQTVKEDTEKIADLLFS